MIKPVKLPSKVVGLLNERVNDEYSAMYFYRNASNWCENKGYVKIAAFFANEALDEAVHAEGLQKYMTDWNVTPTLTSINKPDAPTGIVEFIEAAYNMEYDLYKNYEEISNEILFQIKDTCTFDFLAKYRAFQVSAVAEYATLINKLELIDYEDKNWLFLFEQENF